VSNLLAEIELGLTFARMAAKADDPWLASRERAKASQTYDGVLRLKDRIAMPPAAHADLQRRLEELRRAIHALS
jgi:hypothetical protein